MYFAKKAVFSSVLFVLLSSQTSLAGGKINIICGCVGDLFTLSSVDEDSNYTVLEQAFYGTTSACVDRVVTLVQAGKCIPAATIE